jgi:hypothetical protein
MPIARHPLARKAEALVLPPGGLFAQRREQGIRGATATLDAQLGDCSDA